MNSIDSLDKNLIIKKLEDRDEENISLKELEFALSLNEKKIRILLVRYLEDCGDAKQISFLIKRLPKVFPEEMDINLYKSFLTYSDERIVSNAIEGLAEIKSMDTTALFTNLLSYNSHRVRSVAARSLIKSKPQEAKKIIEKLLNSKDLNMVKAGCHAIENIENDSFISLIIPLLNKPEIKKDALHTIAVMALKHLKIFFEKPEINEKPELKKEILEALIAEIQEKL
jgi:HEAT repeat protein